RLSGPADVFYARIRRGAGHRFLGSLQRGRLQVAADVPGASPARTGTYGEVQVPGTALAGVREEAAPVAGGCNPPVAQKERALAGELRLPPRAADGAAGRIDRGDAAGSARPASRQAPAAPS